MNYKEFLAEEIMNIVCEVLHENLSVEQATNIDIEISERLESMLNILP